MLHYKYKGTFKIKMNSNSFFCIPRPPLVLPCMMIPSFLLMPLFPLYNLDKEIISMDSKLEGLWGKWINTYYAPRSGGRHLGDTDMDHNSLHGEGVGEGRGLGALRDMDCEYSIQQNLCWASFSACVKGKPRHLPFLPLSRSQ
jgi:hypothetical protein